MECGMVELTCGQCSYLDEVGTRFSTGCGASVEAQIVCSKCSPSKRTVPVLRSACMAVVLLCVGMIACLMGNALNMAKDLHRQKQYDAAVEQYMRAFDEGAEPFAVHLGVAAVYLEMGRLDDANRAVAQALQLREAPEALALRAQIAIATEKNLAGLFEACSDETPCSPELVCSQSGTCIPTSRMATRPVSGDDKDAHGLAAFEVGRVQMAEYEAIRFRDVASAEKTLEAKLKLLQQTEQVFVAAINSGSAQWAIAALQCVASMYKHFARFIKTAPIPAGMTAEQRTNYEGALQQESHGYEAKTNETIKACADKTRQLRILTSCAAKCMQPGSSDVPEKRGAEKERLKRALDELVAKKPASYDDLQREVVVVREEFAEDSELGSRTLKAACLLAAGSAPEDAKKLGLSILVTPEALNEWPCGAGESDSILKTLLHDASYETEATADNFDESAATKALDAVHNLVGIAEKVGAKAATNVGRTEATAIEKKLALRRQLQESAEVYASLVADTEKVLIDKTIVTYFGDGRRFHVPAPRKSAIKDLAKRFGTLPEETQEQYLAHLRKLFFAVDASGIRTYDASPEFEGEMWAPDGAVELFWFQQLQHYYHGYDAAATQKAMAIGKRARGSCRGDYSTYARMWGSAAADAYRELDKLLGRGSDYTIVNEAVRIGEACTCTLSCAGVYFR